MRAKTLRASRGNGNVYFKESLINVRVFYSMNKKGVFTRRLAKSEKGETQGTRKGRPVFLFSPFCTRVRISVLLAFHLAGSQSHFALR